LPTRATPRSMRRVAATAPSTSRRGAKSPPMASTAIHNMSGRVQRASRPLLLFDRSHLAAAVIPAVGAHTVWRLRLLALRAFAETDRLQRIVRAALRRPRLGVSSFWIWHRFLVR